MGSKLTPGIITKNLMHHYHTPIGFIPLTKDIIHPCDHCFAPMGIITTHCVGSLPRTNGIITSHHWAPYHTPMGSIARTHGIITKRPLDLCQQWIVVLQTVKYAKATRHGTPMHPGDHNQKLNVLLSHTHGIYTSHQRHHYTHGIIALHPWDHYHAPIGSLPVLDCCTIDSNIR